MRVLLVTPNYPLQPDRIDGGVEGACYNLAHLLRHEFHLEVQVLLVNPGAGGLRGPQVAQVEGIQVHQLSGRSDVPRLWNLMWVLPRGALSKIAQLEWDVVHVHAWTPLAARLGTHSVFTIHGLNEMDTRFRHNGLFGWVSGRFQSLWLRRQRKSIPNIIAISSYVRRVLGVNPRQRVWDIPNPVADRFFQVKRRPVPGRVLAVGRICPRKNTAGLINVFAAVTRDYPQAQLRLAGSGYETPYGASCQALARRLALDDRIKFLGPLSVSQLEAELAAATCVALVSLQETAPLCIAEALAAGVPVLASRVGGVPEMVEDGVTGRLVNPYDQDDIARGLKRLLLEDDIAILSQAARQRAHACYSGAVVGAKTLAVYEEIRRGA